MGIEPLLLVLQSSCHEKLLYTQGYSLETLLLISAPFSSPPLLATPQYQKTIHSKTKKYKICYDDLRARQEDISYMSDIAKINLVSHTPGHTITTLLFVYKNTCYSK